MSGVDTADLLALTRAGTVPHRARLTLLLKHDTTTTRLGNWLPSELRSSGPLTTSGATLGEGESREVRDLLFTVQALFREATIASVQLTGLTFLLYLSCLFIIFCVNYLLEFNLFRE